jgi:hypothetical protein
MAGVAAVASSIRVVATNQGLSNVMEIGRHVLKSKGIETANTWFQGARTSPTLEMLWETMVSEPPMKEEEKNGSQSDGWPGCGSRRV